ncbi:MAG: 4Fe-4S binding protein [Synergistaceae bacterium]|jgi:ferredoxin|nr:4Fe-4S binding protein [Synergistaceae bacterium]
MTRGIIKIDEGKCGGCGLCVDACHEGAIEIIEGRARVVRDDYCDGLGMCLPVCPTGAITLEERDGATGICPGGGAAELMQEAVTAVKARMESELNQWPVQIKLVPVNAPYFNGSNLLISADCAAYAYAGFHYEFMRRHVTLIGCPKLDGVDYSQKLAEIITRNDIRSITVVRMEVPCCGGIEHAVVTALEDSGKSISLRVVTISIKGEILEG